MASRKPVPVEVIGRLYNKGRSVVSIADELVVSKQAVYERMRREGIAYRLRERKDAAITKAEVERLYVDESLTIAEIARRLGLSWGVVARTLDVHGIKRRNNRAKAVRYGIESLRVGDQMELEIDGRYPYRVYADARKLNMRVVIRKVAEKRFAIIRTPLLTRDLVKALRNTGLTIREIAFTYRVDEKRIRKILSQGERLATVNG